MVIIGITGTNGAGKGTIVELLVRKKGFNHFSVGGYLGELLKKKKITVNRENLIELGNRLRKKYGPNVLAETLYRKAKQSGKNSIIESLRNLQEVLFLKEKGGFYLFAVDADPKVRYERIQKRNTGKDRVTFAKFSETEKGEMNSKDPSKENVLKCISLADFKFENNGPVTKLYTQVQKALNEIYKKIK